MSSYLDNPARSEWEVVLLFIQWDTDLTLPMIADKTGISIHTLRSWLQGKCEPTVTTLKNFEVIGLTMLDVVAYYSIISDAWAPGKTIREYLEAEDVNSLHLTSGSIDEGHPLLVDNGELPTEE